MIKVTDALWRKFDRYLAAADIPRHEHANYRKWLRFYLDFCSKYRHEYANADSVPPFLEKLASKRQDSAAREQAGESVSIYHKMVRDADRQGVSASTQNQAIKKAARQSAIPKRVSAHTFRHSFASHLLQANYDIRTIQELLGHSDVRTTMIYTHTVPSRTLKERKSPLDFQPD